MARTGTVGIPAGFAFFRHDAVAGPSAPWRIAVSSRDGLARSVLEIVPATENMGATPAGFSVLPAN